MCSWLLGVRVVPPCSQFRDYLQVVIVPEPTQRCFQLYIFLQMTSEHRMQVRDCPVVCIAPEGENRYVHSFSRILRCPITRWSVWSQ